MEKLEDNPLFNAGKGAVFNADAGHELDASIMRGSDLKAGAVAGVRNVRNPIQAARLVMDETKHVMLAGETPTGTSRQLFAGAALAQPAAPLVCARC